MAGELLSLIFGITAKADAALRPTFNQVNQDLNNVAATAQKTNATMIQSSKGTQALGAGFSSLSGSIQGSMNQLAAAGGPMGSAIAGVSTALGGMTSAAGLAVGGIGALAGVFVLAANKTREYGDMLGDMSELTLLSTDALGGMSLALEEAGIPMEAFTKGFLKFRENAVRGSDDTKAALKSMGLTTADVTGKADIALANFLKGFQRLGTGVERNVTLNILWSKGYKDLVEGFQNAGGSLDDLIERARTYGKVLDKDAIRAAGDFDRKMRQLTIQFNSFLLKIGPTAITTINTFIDWILKIGPAMSSAVKPTSGAELAIDNFLKRIGKQAVSEIKTFAGYIKWLDDQLAKVGIRGSKLIGKLEEPIVIPPVPTAPEPPADAGAGAGAGLGFGDGKGKAAKEKKKDITAREAALAENERLQKELARQREEELDILKRSDANREEVFRERIRIEQKYIDALVPLLEQEGKLQLEGFEPQQALAKLKQEAETRDKILIAKREAAKAGGEAADALKKAEQDAFTSMMEAMEEYIKRLKEFVKDEADALKKSKEQWTQWAQDVLADAEKAKEKIAPPPAEEDQTNLTIQSVPDTGPWENFFFKIGQGFKDWVDRMRQQAEEMGGILGGIFNLLGDAALNFQKGLEAIAVAYVTTGKTGPAALKKMTGAVLIELAKQAAVYSVFFLALGFGELALGHWAAAAKAFLSAAIFGGIAVGAGALGRSLSGKEGSAAAGEGAGQFGGADKEKDKAPGEVTIGRENLTGQIGGVPAQLFERLVIAIDKNTAASEKIQSQPAGEVFVQGAQQRPEAVSAAAVSQARTNAEFVNQFGRIILGPA